MLCIMDPIRMEKFQAMKRYKRRKQFNIPTPLFKYLVGVSLLLGLFLSSPLWLPKLRSSLNLLSIVVAGLLGPKCLFVVCNLIVVFLVSESRLSGAYSMPDVYEEFARRNTVGSRRCAPPKYPTVDAGERGMISTGFMQTAAGCLVGGGVEEEEEDDEDLVDEWNRRFEDFIARVRKQRRLEAKRMPLCYCYG